MKINKLVLSCFIAFVAGCGGPSGTGFEGKWIQKTNDKPSTLVLRKDGEIYHVDYSHNIQQLNEYTTKKLEASIVSDSVLSIVGSMGAITFRLQDGYLYFKDNEYVKAN